MAVNDGTQGKGTSLGNALQAAGVSPGQFATPGGGQQPNQSTSSSTTSQTGQSAPKGTMNPNQNPQGSQHGGAPSFSLRNPGAGMRTMMTRNRASEGLNKLAKTLEEIYKESADPSFEYSIITLDWNNHNPLSVSSLVLCVRDKQNPNIGVGYHTMVVAGSSAVEFPLIRVEPFGNQNVEVMRLASDAYDATMIEYIRNAVTQRYPNTTLYNTDATLITKDIRPEDKDTLYNVAINAAFACSQELEVHAPGYPGLNLAHVQNDSTLVIRPMFNDLQPVTDVLNHPVRADVQVDFQAGPQNQNQNQTNVERTSSISRLAGYVDLVWDPEVPPQQPMFGAGAAWNQQQQPNFRRYAARFVTTQLEGRETLTIPMQLLALLPANALSENNAWAQTFQPKAKQEGKKDWADIGAIGYEVNFENNPNGVGQMIDTKAESFLANPQNFWRLIGMTFKSGLFISLDVPEVGGSTWYNGVFAAAAVGVPKANQAIIDAANQLTNGAFSQVFPPNAAVVIDENNLIHMGYFTDDKGMRQDLRKLDYLAVLNLTGDRGDLQAAKDWSDSFVRREFHIAQRLAVRKRIITQLVTQPEFTGYARRVTFTPEFMKALSTACAAVGLSPRLAQNYQDMGVYERATGSYLNNALQSSETSQFFNRGGVGSTASPTQGFRSFGGRW